jgi:SHS2 domain-containing protein
VKTYTLIEHTADIGIRTKGDSLKELFQNTALAMFDIIAGIPTKKSKRKEEITIKEKADNIEELFINWLNDLLSLSAAKELIFTNFKIEELDEHHVKAVCSAEDAQNFKINTEIKAATYHELKLEQTKSGWQAEVILDV